MRIETRAIPDPGFLEIFEILEAFQKKWMTGFKLKLWEMFKSKIFGTKRSRNLS